jgi:hypothetical protein
MIGFCIFSVIVIAVLGIHGVRVAPFIKRHGVRTTGFFALGLPGVDKLIRDYLAARRICRERGIRPRWMGWFTSLLIAEAVLGGLILSYILFLSFR